MKVNQLPPQFPLPNSRVFIDLTGQIYGRLTVQYFAGRIGKKLSWVCSCECGSMALVRSEQLRSGDTQSCGCLNVERTKAIRFKHGGNGTKTYNIWRGMRQRCQNQKSKWFHRYGGRGIRVCARWSDFKNFLEDMGEAPEGMTLERENTDGDYCKENCSWATRKAQTLNRSVVRMIEFEGQSMCAPDWDRQKGFRLGTIWGRLNRGWSIERAMSTPAPVKTAVGK